MTQATKMQKTDVNEQGQSATGLNGVALTKLSPEILLNIAQHMSTQNVAHLSMVSKELHKILSPLVPPTKITHTAGKVTWRDKKEIVGKKMEAELNVNDPVMGNATGPQWQWYRGVRQMYPKAGVVRGHLLNHDLGGQGFPQNLYPISTKANAEHSKNVEQPVKKLLNEQQEAVDGGAMPSIIYYSVDVDEVESKSPTFESAKFKCKWGIKGGTINNYDVSSNLSNDTENYFTAKKKSQGVAAVVPHPNFKHKEKYKGIKDFYNGKVEISNYNQLIDNDPVRAESTNGKDFTTKDRLQSIRVSNSEIVNHWITEYGFNFEEEYVVKIIDEGGEAAEQELIDLGEPNQSEQLKAYLNQLKVFLEPMRHIIFPLKPGVQKDLLDFIKLNQSSPDESLNEDKIKQIKEEFINENQDKDYLKDKEPKDKKALVTRTFNVLKKSRYL